VNRGYELSRCGGEQCKCFIGQNDEPAWQHDRGYEIYLPRRTGRLANRCYIRQVCKIKDMRYVCLTEPGDWQTYVISGKMCKKKDMLYPASVQNEKEILNN
jgi:hypothetical protein